MTDMTKSIDDMMLSIEYNNKTIEDMLTKAKENNSMISYTMHGFTVTHACLAPDQMKAYADYAKEYDYVAKLGRPMTDKKRLEHIHNIHNEELAYSMLDEVHEEQLTLMERLCTLLEKAGHAMKLLKVAV
ncbi:MAG: hypothetical protein IJ736_16055 [Firmicutes bacterium]|nr:hypothetical protein [Bacillota bacterium]